MSGAPLTPEQARDRLLTLARAILREGDGAAEALGADLALAVLAYLGALREEPPSPQ